MWYYIIKVLLTATVVVAVAEIGKRSTLWGAAIASVPLTSVLAFVWLYFDTGNAGRIAELSLSIFWFVLPSLALFLVLAFMLRAGVPFAISLGTACASTAVAYFAMVWCLGRLGVRL